MKIVTDYRRRDLISLNDLPAKVQQEFDYVREKGAGTTYRFVKYKGVYYDVYDTQRIRIYTPAAPMGWDMVVKPDDPFAKWHAVISDTYFSGVLFKFDHDQVVVGRYFS